MDVANRSCCVSRLDLRLRINLPLFGWASFAAHGSFAVAKGFNY